jgi:FkbM family methyltransferase
VSRLKLLGNINESALVAAAFGGLPPGDRVMLDVGASRGSAFKHFVRSGWRVIAFEPDPKTRSALRSRWGHAAKLTIEDVAISNKQGLREFFHNDAYPGMSGFHAYEAAHQSIGEVRMTTLAAYCEQHRIDHVDFLKVDTEGEDIAVLEGVPWSQLKPRVIEVEYAPGRSRVENTFEPLARLLTDQGYRVHVSEFAPFVLGNYRWLRFVTLPDRRPDPAGWGNIIATLDDEIDHRVTQLMRLLEWPWRLASRVPQRARYFFARSVGRR